MTPADSWKRAELAEQSFLSEVTIADATEEASWIAPEPTAIEIVCLSNLDIYDGDVSRLSTKYGNLNDTSVEEIMDSVMEARSNHSYLNLGSDRLYFNKEEMPSITELARAAGDYTSDKIHPHRSSMRNRWLDCI